MSLQPPRFAHHALWSIALMASSLIVFVLSYHPERDIEPPAELAIVATPRCPSPVLASKAMPEKQVAVTTITEAKKRSDASPKRRSRITKAETPKPPPPITVETDCDGPLCGLPE